MIEVGIAGFAQSRHTARWHGNEIELLQPVVADVLARSGVPRSRIGFSTLGSSDFYAGQAFAFVRALDAIGIYPVADDSHVDMDGAWALYEAWVKLQLGEVDAALVTALGLSGSGRLHEIAPLALDPYYLAPLQPDPHSLAALQAQLLVSAGLTDLESLRAITERDTERARANPRAVQAESREDSTPVAGLLRRKDLPPITDGAAAMVLVTRDFAEALDIDAVWIRAIEHRVEPHSPGARDLTRCRSARLASEAAGASSKVFDLAELHCLYPHERVLLQRELGLGKGVAINPSGGPAAANPVMATGLIRIGEASEALRRGEGERALAHASSGPCLQHNLICVLEGASAHG